MPPTLESYGLDKLSLDDRVALRDALDDSIYAEVGSTLLTPEMLAELRRRDAEMDANPDLALTWEQVKAGLRAGGSSVG